MNDLTTGEALLLLPEGFSYRSFGRTGTVMHDGIATPSQHDGMGVVGSTVNPDGSRSLVLVRNHERAGAGTLLGSSLATVPTYNPGARGGTTNLLFNLTYGQWERSWLSLRGTSTNCAGGITPQGTWLTGEENLEVINGQPHGWLFEVPAFQPATAQPLRALGRFRHEAAAVDPRTGIVYQTEDDANPGSGFYRFLPTAPGDLARGGVLQMLRVRNEPGATLNNWRGTISTGAILPVDWVTISDPQALSKEVRLQGREQGAAYFSRLEGCWSGGNGLVYFSDTDAGAAREGQVWEYDARNEWLKLVFSSPSASVLSQPDNIALSPRTGSVLLCEDRHSGTTGLQSLGLDGTIAPFALNNISGYTTKEWAGATFGPVMSDGRYWLFVNIQDPGITFAITGPWERGPL